MTYFTIVSRQKFTIAMLLILFGISTDAAFAQSIITKEGSAAIQVSPQGNATFVVRGVAPHFGRYRGYGEAAFVPGQAPGSLDGAGVAVVEAADGDRLVAVVSWRINSDGSGQVRFSWRDSVEFSDGTVASTTGRFVTHRPPGLLVVIAIIAILIG